MPFIEERRLKPDLTKILREVSETAENRYAHEVPPGFGDGGKMNEQSSSVNDGEAEKVKGCPRSYGTLAPRRQAEIIRRLGEPTSAASVTANAAMLRQLVDRMEGGAIK
jgi:hypothetical protein